MINDKPQRSPRVFIIKKSLSITHYFSVVPLWNNEVTFLRVDLWFRKGIFK